MFYVYKFFYDFYDILGFKFLKYVWSYNGYELKSVLVFVLYVVFFRLM